MGRYSMVLIESLARSLMPRDIRVLWALHIHGWLWIGQIHRHEFASATRDRASQRMRQLALLGLVASLSVAPARSRSRFSFWRITILGFRVLSLKKGEIPLPRRTIVPRTSPQFIAHLAESAEVALALERLLRKEQMRPFSCRTGRFSKVEWDS